jgi:DNA repair exonuclease SbcCD ATPase subunit
MEPLIFKIETQADDSGVRKFDKSIGGLDSSAKKASAALGSFSRDLLNARSGADVAAAGADALSRVLQKSLAGAVVIGGIKIVADQIEQMAQVIRSAGEATGAAVTQLERMGEVRGIEDAAKAVGILDGSLEAVTKQLGGIQSGNWFTQLIDGATGTSKELKEQIITLERLRDGQIALGFAAERISAERIQGLTDEQKQYDAIDQKLNKRLELADKISNQALKAAAIQDANALAEIEKRNLTIKLTEEQGKKEADLATQREKDAAAQLVAMEKIREAQQKRFNELYDAEIKSQEQMQKRIDAELKAAQELADKQKALLDAQEEARSRFPAGATGQMPGGGTPGGQPNIPGITIDTSKRPSSAEVGGEQAIQRAYLDGIQKSTEALRQYIENQLKASGLAHDQNAVTNELIRIQKELAFAKGEEVNGIANFLEGVKKAAEDLYDFNNSIKEASKTTTHFETTMQEIEPSFDKAIKSVTNLADSMTQNTEDLVKNFLKTADSTLDLGKDMTSTGSESDLLGKSFTDLGKVADNLTDKLDKDKKDYKGNETLEKIHKLLDDNLKEMRTYAFVK